MALALLAGLAWMGCSTPSDHRSAPSDPSMLRVGFAPDRPPMTFQQGDRVHGIEPELAQQAARELGRRFDGVVMEPGELVPALQRGELDTVMSPSALLAAGPGSVLLTQPYLRTGQRLVIRRADLAQLGLPGAMQHTGARVGYVYSSPGEEYVRQHLDPYNRELYGFASASAGVRSLKAERIDFFIHAAPAVWWLTSGPNGSDLIVLNAALTEEDQVFGVAEDNLPLKRALDRLIDEWRASNTLPRVIERWIPERTGRGGSGSSGSGTKVDSPNGG